MTMQLPRRTESCDASRLACLALAATFAGVFHHASAQTLQPTSRAEFTQSVRDMQHLAAACEANATACDESRVVPDLQVGESGKSGSFTAHWQWLRDALTQVKNPNAVNRAETLHAIHARLAELSAEVEPASSPADHFLQARAATDAILARSEFRREIRSLWWERVTSRIVTSIQRFFDNVAQLGSLAPWLRPLLEWGLFTGAAAGLLFFVFRSFSKQRLRVALGEGAALAAAWDRESEDWAKLAEASAAAGDWREALHGLYWAAIVYLEGRRAWRHNPSRTPREYVRLLKPGSPQQAALRELTQTLERVWYGFGEVDAAQYTHARSLFDKLAAGSPRDAAPLASEAA